MGGRGRGSSTFTRDQLEALGCMGKDMHITGPPQLFPPVNAKPIRIEITDENKKNTIAFKNILKHIHNTDSYRVHPSVAASVFRKPAHFYGKRYGNPIEKSDFDWDRMPAELRPDSMRGTVDSDDTDAEDFETKKPKIDLEKRFAMLAKAEERGGDDVSNEDDSDMELDEDPEPSDDGDDDNDYGNSYFDNGEGMNDDDDLDDGPIY